MPPSVPSLPTPPSPELRALYQRVDERRVKTGSEEEQRALLRERQRAWPWRGDFHLPTFAEFVSSPRYLNEGPLTPVQQRAIEESIGPSAWSWFCQPRKINALWWCFGKGSGKDLEAAWLLAYTGYTIASMVNPWRHFNIPLGEVMHAINVAQDQSSARQVFFSRLVRMLKRPCFEHLINSKKQVGTDEANFTRFIPHLGYEVPVLQLLSLHSRNEAAEGKNTLFWVMDESEALRTADGNRAAEALLKTLTTSNRFGSQQLGVSISYPREQDGFMLSRLDLCGNLGGSTREWWGLKAATYEVLPWKVYIPVREVGPDIWEEITDWRECDGTEHYTNHEWKLFIPADGCFTPDGRWVEKDAEMARIYRDDPELFEAMYRCNPPAAEGAFFSMSAKIDEAIKKWLKPCAEVEHGYVYAEVEEPDGEKKVYKRVSLTLHNIQLRPNVTYFIGGDAGEVQDSFALCLSHFVPPGEEGYLCPKCGLSFERRLSKHYLPKKPPESLPPGSWPCDCCGTTPPPGSKGWWVCTPSGRKTLRPVIEKDGDGRLRYHTNGEPVYRMTVAANGEPMRVMEEVWEPVVVEDLLLEWKPDKAKQITVDYASVAKAILDLAAVARIGGAKFDKWNSTSIIQSLQDAGIPCESKAFSNTEQLVLYRNYKSLVYNNMVFLLPGEDRRRTQLRQLVLINNTRIDHPPQGGKDLTDAEALSLQQACQYAELVGRIDLGGNQEEYQIEKAMERVGQRARAGDAAVDPGGLVGQALRGISVSSGPASSDTGAGALPDLAATTGRIL